MTDEPPPTEPAAPPVVEDEEEAPGGVSVVAGRGYTVKQHTIDAGGRALPLRPGGAFTALLWSVAHVANGDKRGGDRIQPQKTYYTSPEAYFAINYPRASAVERAAFLARPSVVAFEERKERIAADPEAWLAAPM